ncbi:vacuolar amino acid transporter, putative [Pediculus humanus corporis]|uniref:Putative sodium-coupled neutral amino acid transporter 11 n=1 Tax=Pediculus humanus subsp. corporis TaxID=121224 RepID=E0W379_PEDHC|nr:vacuolar amino acid transporter, putative [Pediculus humanus corporis]EEB20085.1 vacuolar amino acid transporter, putative [Pediculus humanus corporis]
MSGDDRGKLVEKFYILDNSKSFEKQDLISSSNSCLLFGDANGELIESKKKDKSSLLSASFNYINSIIGSGVIGIPFALREAGFGLGLLMLILVALVTDYSLILMIKCGYLSGNFTYQGIMESAFGKPGFILLSILQFAYPFIAMVSYNIVVGDTMTKVFVRMLKLDGNSFFSQREVVVFLATTFITLPLCLYNDVVKLTKVSFFSLVCEGFILLVVMAEFFMLYSVVPKTDDAWNFINTNLIPAVGVMTFAFICHHNTFLIFGSIKDVNQKKWNQVTHISMTVSFLIAFVFGIVGYATFTGVSQGDLLENYCPDDDLISAARIFFGISILLTYPLDCFVAREIIGYSFFDVTNTLTKNQHFFITFLLVFISYLISVSTDCLGIVLELNGVLVAVPLAYILPALCFLKLEPSSLLSKNKLSPIMLFLFGLVVAFLGIIFVVNNYKTLGNCKHGEIMEYCKKNTTTSIT